MRYMTLPAVAVVFALTFIIGWAAFKAPVQTQSSDATATKPADQDLTVNPLVKSGDPISSEAQEDSQILENARRLITSLENLITLGESLSSPWEPSVQSEFKYVARCHSFLRALKPAYSRANSSYVL